MAIEYGDGKAGQYAKSQAQKRIERFWSVNVWAVAILSALLGMCAGFAFTHDLTLRFGWARRIVESPFAWVPLLAEGAVIAGGVIALRLLRGPLDSLVRERVKWLRGGQAEALIAWRLRDLDDEWHLFNNVKLKMGGDLDHVLVGPGGVFCLSTKSHKGIYSTAKDGSYLLNGKPTDQLEEAKQMALKLRNWFEVKLHDSPNIRVPWIQPILVVPFAYVDFDPRQQAAWVIDDNGLMDIFNNHPRRLDAKSIAACMNVLKEMTGRNQRVAEDVGKAG